MNTTLVGKGTEMESYATYSATVDALYKLGFIPLHIEDPCRHFDSPGKDEKGIPVAQVYLYQCRAGYWCASIDDSYMATVIWNGPKAPWDNINVLDEFTSWLDTHHPGWKL